MSNLKIVSNFKDYYDDYCDDNNRTPLTYNRFHKLSKLEELKLLKSIGINSIKLEPVQDSSENKIIVYTNLDDNTASGRVEMKRSSAELLYPNKLSHRQYDNETITRSLHIGKRRFKLVIENKDDGKILETREINGGYNIALGIPIYSIDYVLDEVEMIAYCINTAPKLEDLNINKIMTEKEVREEIYSSLIKYNKG